MIDSTQGEICEGMDRQLYVVRKSHFKQVRCFDVYCYCNYIVIAVITFIWVL